jgi:hypothetical protein
MRLIHQEFYWTYKAPPTPDSGPPGFVGNWFGLSPGMRREIWRGHERRTQPKEKQPPAADRDFRREYLDRKTEVQIAARELL